MSNKLKYQYLGEYNYYQAITGWRGSYQEYLKYRTRVAVAKFN